MSAYRIERVEGTDSLYEVFHDGVWQGKIRVAESGFAIIRGYLDMEAKAAVRLWLAGGKR